jgi:hypothetical protein
MSEVDATDCRIASLLAGAYGSMAYCEDSYGYTIARQERAVGSAALTEMIEWVAEETGLTVDAQDVLAVMLWAHGRFEAAEERAAERMRDGALVPA